MGIGLMVEKKSRVKEKATSTRIFVRDSQKLTQLAAILEKKSVAELFRDVLRPHLDGIHAAAIADLNEKMKNSNL